MSSPAENQDRRTEALEWVGRQLHYESFLADLRARAGAGAGTDRRAGAGSCAASEHVAPICGRTGRPATDEARDTAAA